MKLMERVMERIRVNYKLRKVHCSNLLESPRTRIAHIEFTSRCNIRCVYCCSGQAAYKGIDLDVETMERAIESLKARKVKVVTVSGHGETTIYKDWHRYCNNMLDAGMVLHIISNFAREFSTEELNTLSRFNSIEVSCDIADPALFMALRRGADLKTLCLNVLRIRGRAARENRQPPTISFSCVVSDQNIFHLRDYVSFGIALGVTHFNFCNLTKYPDLKNALNPKHITEMPTELLPRAVASLRDTFAFLDHLKVEYHLQQGLLDSLAQKIQETKTDSGNTQIEDIVVENTPVQDTGEARRYAVQDTSGGQSTRTRDCLDPWQFIMIKSDRQVMPCCWHEPVSSLGKRQSLSGVFDSVRLKALRLDLLSGHLSAHCMNCPSRGWTSTKDLEKKVWKYLNPGINRLLYFKKSTMKTDTLTEFPLVYGQGWHGPEADSAASDRDLRSWRWTSQKALCTLENPRRDALLVFWGSVVKSALADQRIRLTINDTVLDEFVPETDKFFREYVIAPGIMGVNDSAALTIETDKIFIPSELNPGVGDGRELGVRVNHLFFGTRF